MNRAREGGRWAGDGQGSRRDTSRALVCFFFYLKSFLNLLIHIFYISYRLQYTKTTHRPHPRYKRELVGLFLTLRHDGMQIRLTDPTLATNASRWGCFLPYDMTACKYDSQTPPSLQTRVGGVVFYQYLFHANRWVVLRQQQTVCRPTKTGPNDAFGVVWAISKFFPSFSHVLSILIIKFRLLLMFLMDGWVTDGRDDENEIEDKAYFLAIRNDQGRSQSLRLFYLVLLILYLVLHSFFYLVLLVFTTYLSTCLSQAYFYLILLDFFTYLSASLLQTYPGLDELILLPELID